MERRGVKRVTGKALVESTGNIVSILIGRENRSKWFGLAGNRGEEGPSFIAAPEATRAPRMGRQRQLHAVHPVPFEEE